MTRCPACGTTYATEAKFCPKDGSKLLIQGSVSLPPRNTEQRAAGAEPQVKSAPVSHANMVGQVLDRRYQIEKKVGEGGMSFVYLAHDVATRERYAIKILSPSLSKDTNAMARLRREAGLGIRLEHPNICHIMRLGETEDGFVYIVMPFVEGELLVDRTNRMGHIPLEETVRYVSDMSAGLNIAHDLKIIHRDLKPENIMLLSLIHI